MKPQAAILTAPPVAMAGGFAMTPCQNVKARILDNAMKTGKDALRPTTMAIRMVESALVSGALSEQG